jgi:flagellin-like hook-associated protein FlgL
MLNPGHHSSGSFLLSGGLFFVFSGCTMIWGVNASGLDMAAQFAMGHAFNRLTMVSSRLAAGTRLVRGSDDPAGIIAAGQLADDLAAWQRAREATERSRSFVHVADSALGHVSGLITDLRSHYVAAANDTLSPEQRDALQLQIDAELDAIRRLGGATLNGQSVFGRSAQFLVGSEPYQTATLNLPAVDDGLGGGSGTLADLRSGGAASVNGDRELATRILDEAQAQVLSARAEAGTFERYVLDSSQRVMEDAQSNLASALSAVRDTDYAAESSRLVRDMILADTAVSVARLTFRARRLSVSLFDHLLDVSG